MIDRMSFGQIVSYVYGNAWAMTVLGLLAANVMSGLARALYSGSFRLGEIGDFLRTRALPYVLGAGSVQVVLYTAPPEWSGVTDAAASAVWLFAIGSIAGHTFENLRQMGMPLPAALGAKKDDATSAPSTPTIARVGTLGVLAAALVLVTTSACGKKIDVETAPGKVAHHAVTVMQVVVETQEAMIAGYSEGRIPASISDPVMTATWKITEASERVSLALKALQVATTLDARKSSAADVERALTEIEAFAKQAFDRQWPEGIAATASRLWERVRAAVATIRNALTDPIPATVPPPAVLER